jgi:hypothetical protein
MFRAPSDVDMNIIQGQYKVRFDYDGVYNLKFDSMLKSFHGSVWVVDTNTDGNKTAQLQNGLIQGGKNLAEVGKTVVVDVAMVAKVAKVGVDNVEVGVGVDNVEVVEHEADNMGHVDKRLQAGKMVECRGVRLMV